jgi:tetratricopeptide (TPR) repeat protein/transcriptional regulator with XRE-family HTH domain
VPHVETTVFGQLLRRYRIAAGLTQEELAQRSGLSARAIANLERGRTSRPHPHSVRSLADGLRLSAAQLEEFAGTARQAAAPATAAVPGRPEPRRRDQAPAAGSPQPGRPGWLPAEVPRQLPVEVPRQLPAAVGCFTGRDGELAALTGLLACGPDPRPPTLVISAIAGTAGVGKTALAVQWAHQVAERFPDGQLHVNLRGYDPGEPVMAADALAGLLRSLGVPGTDIPDEPEDRARLYRSRLAGRRVLVLLDNARDGDQVRPLLPGDPGCVTVVTSRDALAGLVAADGARRLELDVLPPADALALLRALIGDRADEDPGAAAELTGLCARLPLALRIAAELAVARRSVPLADLVAELTVSRLDALDAGDDRADVRAVISWSYRHLPDDVAAAFALAGLHPGEDLDAHAAAALTGTTVGQARRVLGRLHRASLLHAAGNGRYGLHDLLRAYAREQATARDADGACHQALTRLFDYYLAAAAAAMDILYPAEARLRPPAPASAAAGPAMTAEADARAWLDTERANLVAVAAHCAGHDWPAHAAGLARTLFRYLMNGSHLPDAHTIYRHALQAARRSGDLAAEADALNGLGGIGVMKGWFRDAAGHYQAALERYRQCGDAAGQARALGNLGTTEYHQHNHQSAAGYYRQAVDAYHDAGDGLSAARALADLATAETELGAHDQAADHLGRAVPVLHEANDQHGEARALERMGELSLRRGQLTQAGRFFGRSLAISRRIGNTAGVATGLSNLGVISLRRGDHQQAIGHLRQALALHRQAGYQQGEIEVLRALAETLHGAGQPAAARAELQTALQLAADTGNTYEQASTHRHLAEDCHRGGADEQARHHWQQALTLYTQLGVPEADQVRSLLSARAAEAPQ